MANLTGKTNLCFIAHSYDSPSQNILLHVCSDVLPLHKLEPWYSSFHEDNYQTLENIEYDLEKSPLEKVVEMIGSSRYGIYDLTMWEDKKGQHFARNVFIELGIAIGLNRPALLLYQNGKGCLPIPDVLQSLDIVGFSGETTLRNELEKRLPKWKESTPEQDWWNRYCFSGQRSCAFREVASCNPNWRETSIQSCIVDGDDIDRFDFRSVVEDILNQYSNNTINYNESTSLGKGYKLKICSTCQTSRNSALTIYRLSNSTPPEAYIGIGIDLAQEKQFEFKKPKLFLSESMDFVPSLLTKYEILIAQNDGDARKKLKISIPKIFDAVWKVTWKPHVLPFIELINPTTDEVTDNGSNPQYSNQLSEIALEFPKEGEVRQGVIASVSKSQIIVSVGSKSEGIIMGRELEQIPVSERKAFKIGQEIPVYILDPEDQNGNIILSYTRAQEAAGWELIEKMQENNELLEGTIDGYNKGGLIVLLHGLRGFIPSSQISMARRSLAQGETADRWARMVGETINVRIIEIDRVRRRLILSERAANLDSYQQLKEQAIKGLEEGQVYTGRVVSVADFGVFVNVNGADCLVHLSEISWNRITHPSEVLDVGQEVKVKIIAIDKEKKRIGASIRALQTDPWNEKIAKFKVGQLVEGTITRLTKFGVFARLEGDVEGLIHISELSERSIKHPKDVVKEGDVLTLRVIRIDEEPRRIALSLRKVKDKDTHYQL